jgi:MFS family permease
MTTSDIETADRVTRKRALMLPVLAMLVATQQAAYFAALGDPTRLVDHVRSGAWLLMSVAILLLLAGHGGWIHSKAVRALLNDESTRANRADAFRMGFLLTMIAGIALFLLDQFEPLRGRDTIHTLVTIGLATALLRFGYLERRALKDG